MSGGVAEPFSGRLAGIMEPGVSLPEPIVVSAPASDLAQPRHERDVVGVALAALACLVFSLVDAAVKSLSAEYSIAEIAFGINATTLVLFWVAGRWTRRPGRTAALRLHVTRGVLIMLAAACAFFAYSRVPLAEAYTLNFTGPLFVTALSGAVLGEHVETRRWVAVLGGFAGVLVILRPGTAVFQPAALGAVANAFFFGLSLLVTRRLTATEAPLVILVWGALVCALGFGAMTGAGFYRPPSSTAAALLAAAGLGNAIAMVCLVHALAIARASVVAPVQYSQMLWAVLLGRFLFGDVPDVWTFVGCAVIVASAAWASRET
jgi:drug/metabolite transporter (DMT)-like permease